MTHNDSAFEHVKRIDVLLGTCMPCSSLNWHQSKVAKVGKFEKIKIDTGLRLVKYGIENESNSIDAKLIENFKDNELGLRHAILKLSLVDGVIDGIKMNYQREKKLWFEVFTGAKTEDEVECEGEKGTLQQILQKVEINQRRIFLRN